MTSSDSEGELEVGGAGRARGDETAKDAPAGTRTPHFRIGYPSQTIFKCPVCDVCYNTLASLRRHVKVSHERYTLTVIFSCDACDNEFSTIKTIKKHQKDVHGPIEPPTTSNGAYPCSYCPMRFPSKTSLSQHVRGKHMEEASQARAATAASEANGGRKPWDAVEINLFKSALLQVGPNSNIEITKIIGTRDNKQVGVFKRSFLAKNPDWIANNQPSAPRAPIEQSAGHSVLNLNLNLNLNLPAFLSSSPPHPVNVCDIDIEPSFTLNASPSPPPGWARRRNQGRRPPTSSLIQPSSQSTPPSDTATPNNTDASKRNHRSSGRQRSIAKARLLQRLYRTNPSVCVRKILDDTPPTYCTIPESSEEDVLDAPFTPMEIQHQIRRAKKSAPGRTD
ncbi:hypothetical protein EMCRGX_G005332 [Ephydatia muelleri]